MLQAEEATSFGKGSSVGKGRARAAGLTLDAGQAGSSSGKELTMARDAKRSDAATFRRGFSRGLGVGLIPLIACLALGGGLLYAQSSGDALFIDPKGWIGIGTTTPKATLDVAGKLNVSDSTTLSNAAITGSLTTSGSLGVGTTNPGAKLEVAGDTRLNGPVGINTPVIPNQHLVVRPNSGNIPFNITDPAGGLNWLSVLSNGNVVMNGGNVGIGTTDPGEYKLKVEGSLYVSDKLEMKGDLVRSGSKALVLVGIKQRLNTQENSQGKWIDLNTIGEVSGRPQVSLQTRAWYEPHGWRPSWIDLYFK
jgi:hypothetical protein